MKRIVVANQKGGVGKTAAAINVAAVLARSQRVLGIDTDPQSASTRQLGVVPGETTLVEVLSGAPAASALVRLDELGLSLLPLAGICPRLSRPSSRSRAGSGFSRRPSTSSPTTSMSP